VLGDIAPNTAADDAPLNAMLPSWVNVHPGAVNETDVAAVLLAQFTPTTTASLAAFADEVKLNVSPDEDPPCCANTFVCEMLAQAGEQTTRSRKSNLAATKFDIGSRLSVSFLLLLVQSVLFVELVLWAKTTLGCICFITLSMSRVTDLHQSS
jgi:hypothetical protein